jgi:DMSO/TMAO reductase YedYZ heme-binding membrane subunit
MIYVITVFPLVLYAFFFHKFIRKYEFIHYIVIGIIALAFGVSEGHNFFNEGFLGVSFFFIVMFTGVLAKGKLKRNLNQIRAQYAIIGFILISGHALPYLFYLLEEGMIFVHFTIPLGILSYAIFMPLFVTSFMFVRRRMTLIQWKRIHKFAYLGYGLIFFHLFLIDNSRQVFYLVVFIIYTILKVISALDKQYTKKKLLLNQTKIIIE